METVSFLEVSPLFFLFFVFLFEFFLELDNSYCCMQLRGASSIASRMRKEIKDNLGYSCSIGISCNKMLAKIASGFV